MAFKLDKDGIARRDAFIVELTALRDKLEDAVSIYNAAVEAAKEPVVAALTTYNEKLEEARSFAEDIVSQADNDISEKSEKWQESERGEAAATWKEEWENASLDAHEIEFHDELSFDTPGHPEELEHLPEGAES